jgi:hypothetical protein
MGLADGLLGKADGEAPLPAFPNTTLVDTIRALSGNEMLAAILKEHDELKKQLGEWGDLARRAEKRKPGWQTLCDLLDHANGLAEGGNSRPRRMRSGMSAGCWKTATRCRRFMTRW